MNAGSAMRAPSTAPRPWAGVAAFTGVFGLIMWLPSWTLSGLLGAFGLACVATGWKSAPRRWLLWLALAINGVLVVATALAWDAFSEWWA
jgi:hypothetical protein